MDVILEKSRVLILQHKYAPAVDGTSSEDVVFLIRLLIWIKIMTIQK